MAEYPKMHPRVVVYQKASLELSGAMLEIRKKYAVTPSEEFLLLSEQLASLASMCLRHERSDKVGE